jgi:molecular chaperone DnaK
MLVCSPIIHRGTPLPVTKSEVYSTYSDGQDTVQIEVYQGEGPVPEANTQLGSFLVEGLSKSAKRGNPIVVQFSLDLNGILTVTASEKLTGVAKTVTLDTRGQHLLNLDAARANLSSLFADEEADFYDDDDSEEDDDETGEADENESAGVETPPATAPAPGAPAPAGLLASAKSLRQRAEALLKRGVADKDAADIQAKLDTLAAALKTRDWQALQNDCDALSDVLFYLED